MASVFLDTTDELLTKLVRSRYPAWPVLTDKFGQLRNYYMGCIDQIFSWEQSRLDTPILSAKVAT